MAQSRARPGLRRAIQFAIHGAGQGGNRRRNNSGWPAGGSDIQEAVASASSRQIGARSPALRPVGTAGCSRHRSRL
eukprot:10715201-Lingulodinium_polyedra.AAC.1